MICTTILFIQPIENKQLITKPIDKMTMTQKRFRIKACFNGCIPFVSKLSTKKFLVYQEIFGAIKIPHLLCSIKGRKDFARYNLI